MPASGVTRRLADFVDFYLQWHRIEGHTPATVRHYRGELRQFLRFLEERGHSLDLDRISAFDVLAHLQEMRERGRSPSSVRTRYRDVAAFFSWAAQWELVGANPALKLKPPKVPRTRKGFLQPEHFQALLNLCPLNTFLGARRQSVLWLLSTTGMRRAEIASLMLADLDWKSGTVRVRLGKGQKERRVPFHRNAQRAVLRYFSYRKDSFPDLWVTEERRPLSYGGFAVDMKRLVALAGLKGVVKDACHIFRRTWAANAVRQGIPRQFIMAAAGWSTPAMLDHYTQAMQEEEGAVEAFRDFDPFAGR